MENIILAWWLFPLLTQSFTMDDKMSAMEKKERFVIVPIADTDGIVFPTRKGIFRHFSFRISPAVINYLSMWCSAVRICIGIDCLVVG